MKLMVIDASIAIKWFITEEEKRDEALAILDTIQSSPHLFFVPELFFNEMLAVFCRLLKDPATITRYLYILENLGFQRIGNGNELLRAAAHLAVKHNLTGYDAVYAASAKLIGGSWITADARAHKRIMSLKISSILGKNA